MSAREWDWTTRAQVRRMLAVDARLAGIDLVFGLAYVLAGCFQVGPAWGAFDVVLPFGALFFVLLYLAMRLCLPDREDKTVMFYANLPRPRALTYWAHAAGLALYALAMEAVALLVILLRLQLEPSAGAAWPVAPYLLVLPFFGIGFWLWGVHAPRHLRLFAEIPVVLAVFAGLIVLVYWDCSVRDGLFGHSVPTAAENVLPAIGLAALAAFFLWWGKRGWMRIQVGELS